jgi:hypothetical protein
VPDPTSVVVVGYRRAVPRTARTVGNTITASLGFLASQAATPVPRNGGKPTRVRHTKVLALPSWPLAAKWGAGHSVAEMMSLW